MPEEDGPNLIAAEEPVQKPSKYDVIQKIETNAQDWAEFSNATVIYGGQGPTFHRLLALEKLFKGMTAEDWKELNGVAADYRNVGEAMHALLEVLKSQRRFIGININQES